MEDVPPAFATVKPDPFDQRLPEITLADVEELRRDCPDLAASLSVPESNALSNLLARSFNQKLTKEEGETLHSLQVKQRSFGQRLQRLETFMPTWWECLYKDLEDFIWNVGEDDYF